ncbi:MAG TPA: DUF3047 domain-containing protein [Syntrophorhabdaceae bacterium]|nr:DUF3047 domain-containing protein [Syntrophorhabdaceae bacterium]
MRGCRVLLRIVITGSFLLLFPASHASAGNVSSQPFTLVFKTGEVGKFPSEWVSANGNGAAKIYCVRTEGDYVFLHADAVAAGVQIGVQQSWSLRNLPVLQWQWRAVLVPEGTNEREKNRNDSVLAVYVVFGHLPFINTIKYVWSDTLPAGTTFVSPTSGNTKIIVVRNGRSQINTWITERRDLLADYRQVFGDKDKDPIATGFVILTDSDNTGTHAIGDYRYIQFLSDGTSRP